jgi:hypothetical protein
MSSETSNGNKGSNFWVWVLGAALLVASGFYIWDKIKSKNKIEDLEAEKTQISADFLKYKTENESMEANYTDLQRRYDVLNEQLGGNETQIADYKAQLAAKDSVLNNLKNSLKTALVDFKSDEIKVENRVHRDVTLFFEISCPGLKPDQITGNVWHLPGKTFRVETDRAGMHIEADENHTVKICYTLATGSSQSFAFSWS